MAKDLRTFLARLASELPAQMVTVSESISTNLATSALLQNLEHKGQFPVMVFSRPIAPSGNVSSFPLVVNSFASRAYIALALDLGPEKYREEVTLEATKRGGRRLPPLVVSKDEAPVKQVVKKGDEVNLLDLPIPKHHPKDAAPFITAGAVVEMEPDLKTHNVSLVRIQLNGARRTGMKSEAAHHAGRIRDKNEKRGLPTPAAIVIGHHPAFYLGCQWHCLGSVNGIDEYEIISGMLDEPIRLVASETFGSDLLVPADAEIIIEGLILPDVRESEGPIAEHTRYYKTVLGDEIFPHSAPVFEATAITHRQEAIYLDFFVGHPDQQRLSGFTQEAKVREVALMSTSSLRAVHLPPSGCCQYIAYLSFSQRVEGEARNAMLAAFGVDAHLKYCVAVDEDIDVFNEAEVLWAVALRTIPSDDCFVISGARSIWLDPSTSMDPRFPGSAKMGIDATKPIGKPFSEAARFPTDLLGTMLPESYLDSRPDLGFLRLFP